MYQEENKIDLNINQLKGEITFERNARQCFVKNILTGQWKKGEANQLFCMNQEPMNQVLENTHRHLTDRLQLVLPLNKKHIFKMTSINHLEELPQQLTIAPGIFPDLLNQGKGYDEFQQDVKLTRLFTKNTTDWQFKFFRFYIGAKIGVDYTQEKLTSGIDGSNVEEGFAINKDFINCLTFSDLRLYTTPHLQYQKGGLRMNLSVPISLHHYWLEDRSSEREKQWFTRTFIEPSLNVTYDLSSCWSLLPAVLYRYQTPTIHELYTNYLFTQYREASKGTSFSTFSQWITSLALKFNNPINGWFWSLTGNVVRGNHNQIAKSVQQDGLHATEMVDCPYHTLQWTARTRLSKTFSFWKTFVGVTAQYMENRQKLMLENEVVPYRTKSVIVSGNYALQPNRYLSMEGTEHFGHTTLSSSIQSDSYALHLTNRLEVNIFPVSDWKFQWSHAWYLNWKPTRSSIYFMDFSLEYTKQKYSIGLQANNALNKRMYQYNALSSLTERTINQTFRPRELLIKIGYIF